MKKRLKLNLERQINGYFCFPASMKSIISLHFPKIRISQKRIFDMTHHAEKNLRSYIIRGNKQKTEGIGSTGIIAVAKEFGLNGFISKKGDLEKLSFFISQNLPVLVDYQCNQEALGESGHYGIVSGIDNKKIQLADPRKGLKNPVSYKDYYEFEKHWYDPSPSSGRWMASFWPKDRKLSIPFKGMLI